MRRRRERIEAAIVLPDRLIALGVREDRTQPRARQVEEASLEPGRKGLGRKLDEDASLQGGRARRARPGREPFACHQAGKDDLVEPVLARKEAPAGDRPHRPG